MSYYFVFVLNWGFDGVCWATGLMFMLRGMIGVSLVKFGGRFPSYDDVHLFSRETITNLWPLLKIDLQGVAMGVWGWWAFDIFTLIGSYLAESVIAAQTIMRSLGLLTFMIPVGFKVACQILIGQNIGRACERAIRHYFKMCMYFSLAVGVLQAALLVVGRE